MTHRARLGHRQPSQVFETSGFIGADNQVPRAALQMRSRCLSITQARKSASSGAARRIFTVVTAGQAAVSYRRTFDIPDPAPRASRRKLRPADGAPFCAPLCPRNRRPVARAWSADPSTAKNLRSLHHRRLGALLASPLAPIQAAPRSVHRRVAYSRRPAASFSLAAPGPARRTRTVAQALEFLGPSRWHPRRFPVVFLCSDLG